MLSKHDHQRLAGVREDIIAKVDALFDYMAANETPMFVCQGVRTAEYQHTLWLEGRPGGPAGNHIVTQKDGFIHKSDHQTKADGFGHAVDCAFLPVPAMKDPWDPRWPWALFGTAAEAQGLKWGGRWKSPVDLDHVYLD